MDGRMDRLLVLDYFSRRGTRLAYGAGANEFAVSVRGGSAEHVVFISRSYRSCSALVLSLVRNEEMRDKQARVVGLFLRLEN